MTKNSFVVEVTFHALSVWHLARGLFLKKFREKAGNFTVLVCCAAADAKNTIYLIQNFMHKLMNLLPVSQKKGNKF